MSFFEIYLAPSGCYSDHVIAAIWLFERAIFSQLVNPFGMPVELTIWQELLLKSNIDSIMVSLILFSWMPYARLINAMVLQVKQAEFIEAARALGAPDRRIVWRHLLPNAISPAIVLAARDVGGMVILASAFTFHRPGRQNRLGCCFSRWA